MATAFKGKEVWSDWQLLCDYLEMTSVKDLREFLKSDLFQPYWVELYEAVIKPAQQEASQTGKQRARGCNLKTAQSNLISGERNGQCRFSARKLNKTQWSDTDHYSLFLHCVRDENIRNAEGIFYGSTLQISEIDFKIWQLLKRVTYDFTPSRMGGSAGAKILQPSPMPRLPSTSKDSSSRAPSSSNASNTDHRAKKRPGNASITTPGSDSNEGFTQDSGEKRKRLGPILGSRTQLAKPTTPIKEEESTDVWAHPNDRLVEISSDEEEIVSSSKVNIPIRSSDASGTADLDTPLTNYERMIFESTTPGIDLSERKWRFLMMREVVKVGDEQAQSEQRVAQRYEDPLIINAMSIEWDTQQQEALKAEKIDFQEFTQYSADKFDRQQKFFDNVKYQREDHLESCSLLKIDNPDRPRIPGMLRSSILQFWQPSIIAELLRWYLRKLLRGCALCDVVGLGKTWEVVGFLLAQWNERQVRPVTRRGPAKPCLIVVPASLVDQWIRELGIIAPNFKVYRYHGDRRAKPRGRETIIDTDLTKRHALFQGQESSARSIVVTAYSTFAGRHGPGALYKERTKQRLPKDVKEKEYQTLDPSWEKALDGCFEIIIMDEAHTIKNDEALSNVALAWLSASFHIFLTATPLLAGARDWKGFLKMIEPKDAEELWSTENLKAWNFHEDDNPYELPDTNPAVELQLTVRAASGHIFRDNIDPIVQGSYLAKIWECCLLRRTQTSSIPFHSDRTIGSRLPKVHCQVFECTFIQPEQVAYDAIEHDLLRKLIYKDKKTKQPRWSFATLRKLNLACAWTRFRHIETWVKASSIAKWAKDPHCLWKWLKKIGAEDNTFKVPEKDDIEGILRCFTNGSPKLRALLRILSEKVVQDEEKAVVWCLYPATQLLVYKILRLLNIDTILFASHLTDREKEDVKEAFNTPNRSGTVMIMSYKIGNVGLNLQKACHHVHLFDPPPNDPMAYQAVGRSRRFGNPSAVVWVWEYYLQKSFNDRILALNIRKALPGLMAELSKEMFRQSDTEDSSDSLLGDWALINGELQKTTVEDATNQGLRLLDPEAILKQLMSQLKGPRIAIS